MSSQGFYRGTSHDQVPFFANKEKKMIEGRKWPPEFDRAVDMKKINMDVISSWISKRITELLGFEDEIVIDYCRQQLTSPSVDGDAGGSAESAEKICPKKLQINLTGFLAKNSASFVKDLWNLLLSAQESETGIPPQFVENQKQELLEKQAEAQRIKEALEKVQLKVQAQQQPPSLPQRSSSVYKNAQSNSRCGSKGATRSPSQRSASPSRYRRHRQGMPSRSRSPHRSSSRRRSNAFSPPAYRKEKSPSQDDEEEENTHEKEHRRRNHRSLSSSSSKSFSTSPSRSLSRRRASRASEGASEVSDGNERRQHQRSSRRSSSFRQRSPRRRYAGGNRRLPLRSLSSGNSLDGGLNSSPGIRAGRRGKPSPSSSRPRRIASPSPRLVRNERYYDRGSLSPGPGRYCGGRGMSTQQRRGGGTCTGGRRESYNNRAGGHSPLWFERIAKQSPGGEHRHAMTHHHSVRHRGGPGSYGAYSPGRNRGPPNKGPPSGNSGLTGNYSWHRSRPGRSSRLRSPYHSRSRSSSLDRRRAAPRHYRSPLQIQRERTVSRSLSARRSFSSSRSFRSPTAPHSRDSSSSRTVSPVPSCSRERSSRPRHRSRSHDPSPTLPTRTRQRSLSTDSYQKKDGCSSEDAPAPPGASRRRGRSFRSVESNQTAEPPSPQRKTNRSVLTDDEPLPPRERKREHPTAARLSLCGSSAGDLGDSPTSPPLRHSKRRIPSRPSSPYEADEPASHTHRRSPSQGQQHVTRSNAAVIASPLNTRGSPRSHAFPSSRYPRHAQRTTLAEAAPVSKRTASWSRSHRSDSSEDSFQEARKTRVREDHPVEKATRTKDSSPEVLRKASGRPTGYKTPTSSSPAQPLSTTPAIPSVGPVVDRYAGRCYMDQVTDARPAVPGLLRRTAEAARKSGNTAYGKPRYATTNAIASTHSTTHHTRHLPSSGLSSDELAARSETQKYAKSSNSRLLQDGGVSPRGTRGVPDAPSHKRTRRSPSSDTQQNGREPTDDANLADLKAKARQALGRGRQSPKRQQSLV